MAQIFHPSANSIAKLSIVAVVALLPILGIGVYAFNMTYVVNLNVPLQQPVEFSHKHHLADDGIDCRFCHTSVEKSSFAGLPSTQTCMTCHSQIWKDSPLLAPVRESFRTGKPIEWARVHDLPDFTYFNHSIHIAKGVGCVTCHGKLDEMPITQKVNVMSMAWCVECHRNPAPNLRPADKVFDLNYKPNAQEALRDRSLVDTYHVMGAFQMTNCSICHR